jgi:phosphoribosylformylglycinamidine synthase
VLKQLLNTPNIASKHSVYRQYDHMVQIGTMVEPGSDAAVIRVPHSNKAWPCVRTATAATCGWTPTREPRRRGRGRAQRGVRRGASAGHYQLPELWQPYKPEVYWTFVEAIRGMGDACRAFGTPVTGGNVSFYNENPTGAIYPTPTIGMLGLLNNRSKALSQEFKQEGDVILLLGGPCNEVGGSEYLKTIHGTVAGMPPQVDLAAEMRLYDAFLEIADRQLARSAHDCSDGGLAVALAECCFATMAA